MENARLFVLAVIFLSSYEKIKAESCQRFSLTSSPMGTYSCPGSNITYTCVLQSSNSFSVLTAWSGTAFQCPPTNRITLTQRTSETLEPLFVSVFCGTLSAMTTNFTNITSPCYTSVLTIPANQTLNGTTVECRDGGGPTVVGRDTLKITSPPGAPNVMANIIGPDMVQVVVNPSSSGGLPTSYNVTISNSSYVYSNTTPAFLNGSAMIIIIGTGLTNNTNYTISSVAINCAGSRNSSDPVTVHVSWKTPNPSPLPTSSTSIASTTSSASISSTTATVTPTTFTTVSIIGAVVGGVVAGAVLIAVIAITVLLICLYSSPTTKQTGKVDGDQVQLKMVSSLVSITKSQTPTEPASQSMQGNQSAHFILPCQTLHVIESLNDDKPQGQTPPEQSLHVTGEVPTSNTCTIRSGNVQEAQNSVPDNSMIKIDQLTCATVQIVPPEKKGGEEVSQSNGQPQVL